MTTDSIVTWKSTGGERMVESAILMDPQTVESYKETTDAMRSITHRLFKSRLRNSMRGGRFNEPCLEGWDGDGGVPDVGWEG